MRRSLTIRDALVILGCLAGMVVIAAGVAYVIVYMAWRSVGV